VTAGSITVSYRLWSRPKVKVGGVYRSGTVMIEVDDIDLLPFSSITDDDLARTGEADLETLRLLVKLVVVDFPASGQGSVLELAVDAEVCDQFAGDARYRPDDRSPAGCLRASGCGQRRRA
jgi:hypothetical protein